MSKVHHGNTGRGPSQRQLRVGELLRRRLSEVLTRGEVHEPELNALIITVGEVRSSPDLRVATAFVLPLGGRDAEAAIATLNRHRGEIRREVVRGLNLKYAPELRFVLDETFDRMDETRRLLGQDEVQRDIAPPSDTDETER